MIPEANAPSTGVELSHSKSELYQASVLLLTIPMTVLISNSFPAGALPALATGSDTFTFGGPGYVWAQLAVVISTVIIFYEIGKRIDFATNYRLLALLAFAGALLGNLPGFYLYTTNFFGYIWGGGFGYIQSFGFPEPSSIINLVTSAVAAFMIPLAGLALAYFRFQRVPVSGAHLSSGKESERPSLLPFFVVCFVVVLIALPVGDLVYRALPTRLVSFPTPPMLDLVSGYVTFFVYPTLFLTGFYLMGRKLDPAARGPTRFAFTVFIGAAAGLFFSELLGSYISSPSFVMRIFYASNLPTFVTNLVVASFFVVILGFAAASLGWVASMGRLESLKGRPVDTPAMD